jgi:hypothetical protein
LHRAKRRAEQLDDYFLIIKRFRRHRKARQTGWTWTIQRRSKPLGVIYKGDNFATPQVARLAGEKALSELLHDLGQR